MLAVPQGCFCCRFSACKQTLQQALASPLPLHFGTFFAFLFLVPGILRCFEHLSWQDMASGGEEALEQSRSPVRATTSQLQQAEWQDAEADHSCIICLGEINNTAYVDGCFHAFCFDCIRQWAARTPACPFCRRCFDRILHMVRRDDDYREYVVGLSHCRQTIPARERVRSRLPEQRYHLRPRPNNNERATGGRGPAGRGRELEGNAAPWRSNTSAHQAAGERPANPADRPVHRYDLRSLTGRVLSFIDSQ